MESGKEMVFNTHEMLSIFVWNYPDLLFKSQKSNFINDL